MNAGIPCRIVRVAALCAAAACSAATPPQATFATPDEAANALIAAMTSHDYPSFLSIAGPQMARFWRPAQPETDGLDLELFVETARTKGIRTDRQSGSRTLLYAGRVEQPFPAPLVKTDAGWRFDDEAGSRELAFRTIRRNETGAIETCRRFREAEFEYLSLAPAGTAAFAERIRSNAGRRDGLFWDGGEDESPMGPPFAAAAFAERRGDDGTRPLFGYFFKILPAQGAYAPGGALDYRTDGRLRKGFALVAWPAEYGVDGVRTFLINHFGDVYTKDLGTATEAMAEGMKVFNPDRTWSKLDARDEWP